MPASVRTRVQWNTHTDGAVDSLLEVGLKTAHRTGWGRFHKMETPQQRDHMQPLQGGLARLAYGTVPAVESEDTHLEGRHGTIPVRIYRGSHEADAPLAVFLHGGGFVAGDLDSHDHICRILAHAAQACVVAVHYRRAPEHRYPTALHDCVDAFSHIVTHASTFGVDPKRVTILGDSAGGNLSAATSLYLRDHHGPLPAAMALIYPAADTSLTADSLRRNARGALLCADDVEPFLRSYLGPGVSDTNPRYLSLVDVNDLQGLPDATVFLAGRDPIRDDGARLALQLAAARNRVRVIEYTRAFHGYLLLPGISPAARRTLETLASLIQTAART